MGFIDEAGRPVDPYQAKGSSSGTRPTFIFCKAKRVTFRLRGMPRNPKLLGIKHSHKRKGKAVVEAYTDTIDHLVGVLAQKPDTADEEKAKRLMGVSYTNRAAAYLLLGDGVNLNKALADGMTVEADPHL